MNVMTAKENPLQVAHVRLRLEGVPCRMFYREEFKGPGDYSPWPFHEERALIFCRTTMEPGERYPTTVMMSTLTLGYVLSDGVEQNLKHLGSRAQTMQMLAMKLRDIDMFVASGVP